MTISPNETTISILTQFVDRLYGDLAKAQGDLKSVTTMHRTRCREVTEREEQISALRRQLNELDAQHEKLLDETRAPL
jgi:chromosome segregation ATPase